jgi:hypothetical protein
MEDTYTHEVIEDSKYYLIGPQQAMPPDGEFKTGTKVQLLSDNGSYSRVCSDTGITAWVASGALRPL